MYNTLRPEDLEHLVLPVISIDEYFSKIDDRRCIVVGFYVLDKSPATDLCVFIEKSNVKTLDVEVSPAPTPDGYYIVFVELDRAKSFTERLLDLLNQVNNLTVIDEWQFKPYEDHDQILDLTEDNINEHVILDPEKVTVVEPETPASGVVDPLPGIDDEEDNADSGEDDSETENTEKEMPEKPRFKEKEPEAEDKTELSEFVGLAETDKMGIVGRHLVVAESGRKIAYGIRGLYSSWPVDIAPQAIVTESSVNESRDLSRVFGINYAVFVLENHIVIENNEQYLILERNYQHVI